MKPIVTFVALTGLIAGYALADEPTATTGNSLAAVKDILIQIEHQWGDAMVKVMSPPLASALRMIGSSQRRTGAASRSK
jgi:hypothetical protein